MTTMHGYQYATIRLVPDVARGVFINAGVLLYSQGADYLGAMVRLDADRLLALAPGVDVSAVEASLEAIADCAPDRGESRGQRFRWLTTPRSTVVQTSPIHTGITADPAAELQRLFRILV